MLPRNMYKYGGTRYVALFRSIRTVGHSALQEEMRASNSGGRALPQQLSTGKQCTRALARQASGPAALTRPRPQPETAEGASCARAAGLAAEHVEVEEVVGG
jgi:hypothetical protein